MSVSDDQRSRLEGQLELHKREMRGAVMELRHQVQTLAAAPTWVRRSGPVLPFLVLAAVAGYTVFRARRHGFKQGVLMPAATGLWQVGLALGMPTQPMRRAAVASS